MCIDINKSHKHIMLTASWRKLHSLCLIYIKISNFADCLGIQKYIDKYKEMHENYKHQICAPSYLWVGEKGNVLRNCWKANSMMVPVKLL